jgi:formate dehydrogenase major subunit
MHAAPPILRRMRWFERVRAQASRWPVLHQLKHWSDGTGWEVASPETRALQSRLAAPEVRVARTICPYCAVGCGQLAYARGNELLAIEGDPASPISAGHLCPKGAASHELMTHPGRLREVRYRPPRARAWQTLPLAVALEMVAERVWESRARTFAMVDSNGFPLRRTTAIAHLGGATLDIEENYLLKKLFTCGLGMVAISNQAQI